MRSFLGRINQKLQGTDLHVQADGTVTKGGTPTNKTINLPNPSTVEESEKSEVVEEKIREIKSGIKLG